MFLWVFEFRLKTMPLVLQQTADTNFTDHTYQSTLPQHCRSTALQAVRNNIRHTELMINHDIIASQQKVFIRLAL